VLAASIIRRTSEMLVNFCQAIRHNNPEASQSSSYDRKVTVHEEDDLRRSGRSSSSINTVFSNKQGNGEKVAMQIKSLETSENKKFWKELICLLSLHYLKMSFALKPAFAPT
jgi:hypothetical protein